MSLRITAILLAVFCPVGLPAADDGSDRPSPAPESTIDIFFDSVELPGGLNLDGIVFQLGDFDSLFGSESVGASLRSSQEFPFSPRRLPQLNYGTGIPSAVQYLGELDNLPAVLPDGNTTDDAASLPVIIPAAGTATDNGRTVQQADASSCTGACGRCTDSDHCPIDVVMAEDSAGTDGSEPSPFRPVAMPLDTFTGQLISVFGAAAAQGGTTSSESCSHAEPPLKAKVEHLLEAARHLAGAGYEEEAKLFRVEAEAIQKASTRLLTEKRQELERLQKEISELEALTGQYQTIQIRCRILEFQRSSAGKSCGDLELLDAPGVHVLTGNSCSPHAKPCSGTLSANQLTAVIHAIENEACGSLKTIAEPVLVTMNGRPATLRSGGEFPILIPVAAAGGAEPGAAIEWRNFGVTLQAVPFVLGDGKVRLSLETEVSDRDFSNTANLNGTVVPGLTTSRFRSDVEAQFGETIAIALNSAPKGGSTRSLLVLVTAHQVEPLPEPHHHVQPPFTR